LLVVVPCDAPDLPVDLVARLTAALDDESIAVASVVTDTRAHPIFFALRTRTAPALAAYLASGRRSVHGWIEATAHRAVSFADEAAFRNLNTLDDLHDRARTG
jgi:molybdopterin-guanine dinucleotide biosynthesis protein A